MQVRSFFRALFSLLLLKVGVFASSIKDSASIGFASYNDNADVQVYSPTFSLFKKLSHNWMMGVKMRIDAITAASIKNGANNTRVDAVTGASQKEDLFDDVRYAPTVMATYDDGENLLTFGGYYSTEIDYTGKSVFVNYVRQLNEQNTAIGIGVSQSFDKWNPVFKRALPRDDRKEGKIDLSINQLITPTFSMQGVVSYMFSKGFLSSPYHYILQDDIAKFENYPDSRKGYAVAIKGVYMVNLKNATNFSYRYYKDDWDIKSHTISGEWLHDFSKNFTSGMRLRYYTQTASNFIKPIPGYSRSDRYFAVDYRMSAFNSIDIGIPFIYTINHKKKLKMSVDLYQTSKNDYIKNWYGIDSLTAVYTTLSYDFDY